MSRSGGLPLQESKIMAYTAYIFDPSFIKSRLATYKKNLRRYKGHDNLVGNAVLVIRERLENDPRGYLNYGPYWWGIKKILVDNGVLLGSATDEDVRSVYAGETDEETIVMAEEFRMACLNKMIPYQDRFILDEEACTWWRLRDPDMNAAIEPMPDIIDCLAEY